MIQQVYLGIIWEGATAVEQQTESIQLQETHKIIQEENNTK